MGEASAQQQGGGVMAFLFASGDPRGSEGGVAAIGDDRGSRRAAGYGRSGRFRHHPHGERSHRRMRCLHQASRNRGEVNGQKANT